MGAIAIFDPAAWVARYPEFGSVTPAQAQGYFDEAVLYLRNDGSGPVRDDLVGVQLMLLNMLTAHIAELNRLTSNGHAVSQLVGRIDSASQGAVSVHAEMDVPAGSGQWFAQTKYGASFWAASAAYRAFRYRPGPRRVFDPVFGGRPIFF
jgi:hypothetical protein